MRVIAGSARGRRLLAHPGKAHPGAPWLRPTADRVREAVFAVLGSRLAADGRAPLGSFEGLSVADLCCGTGAFGIEALSRGAASVVFVDEHPAALSLVARNLAATGLAGERVEVVRGDVRRLAATLGPVDVAFLDPPYAWEDEAWAEVLGALSARYVVAESDRPIDGGPRFAVIRSKRYGGTLVTMLVSSDSAPAEAGDDPVAPAP